MSPQQQLLRVLPPDVFDALEFSAEAWGGVGAGQWFDSSDAENHAPVCPYGHAIAADGEPYYVIGGRGEAITSLIASGLTISDNDTVLRDVAMEPGTKRIPFAEWCRRLNVVRGDEPTFEPANFPPASPVSRPSSLRRPRQQQRGK